MKRSMVIHAGKSRWQGVLLQQGYGRFKTPDLRQNMTDMLQLKGNKGLRNKPCTHPPQAGNGLVPKQETVRPSLLRALRYVRKVGTACAIYLFSRPNY